MSKTDITEPIGIPECFIDEPHPMQPIYADGFADFQVVNGVMRCTGYVVSGPDIAGLGMVRTAVVKLIISLAGADLAQMETHRVLREKPIKSISIWKGDRAAH